MIRVRCASVKFETPIERTRPSFCRSTSARQASGYLPTLGFGQWMRCRSRWSSPSRSSDPCTLATASSYAWWRPGILLATCELLAGQAGAADRLADLALVLVVHRGVEQPVAGLERADDRRDAVVALERVGAEADRRAAWCRR